MFPAAFLNENRARFMESQSFSIDFKGAYTLEEQHMLSFERLLKTFCKQQPLVSVEYDNGHQISFADMSALLDSPFTRGRDIKNVSIRGQSSDLFRSASVTIRRSFSTGSLSADIAARDADVVQLESLLQSEVKAARRYYWPIRQFVFPIFLFTYIVAWLGSAFLGIYDGAANPDIISASVGLLTGGVFASVILIFFPRVEFDFGRGKKAVQLRSVLRKFVGSTVVVGYCLYLLFENLGNPFA